MDRTIDDVSSLAHTWHLLAVLREEASQLVPASSLWVLFPKCAVSSTIGFYPQVLADMSLSCSEPTA